VLYGKAYTITTMIKHGGYFAIRDMLLIAATYLAALLNVVVSSKLPTRNNLVRL
jgi:hypothetical protein